MGETAPGPETNIQAIAKAYFHAVQNSNEELLQPSFTSLYEVNQRVELGQSLKFIDTFRRVKCILREGTKTTIALSIDMIFYDQYGNVVERKPSVDFAPDTHSLKTEGLPAREGESCPEDSSLLKQNLDILTSMQHSPIVQLLTKGIEKSSDLLFVAKSIEKGLIEYHKRTEEFEEKNAKKVEKVTLHNLQVQDLSIAPPSKVQQKPNCAGIENCIFNAKQIQFDIVEWFNASDFRKTRSRWVVTPQLPSFPEGMLDGFGGFISKCESGFQTIITNDENGNPEEKEYLITTCSEVLRNF